MPNQYSLFDTGLAAVIIEAHRNGFTVKSDFARSQADYVGMAASLGLISTKVFANLYSRDWRPTVDGLRFLQALDVEMEDE